MEPDVANGGARATPQAPAGGPRLTVLVPTYNRAESLARCIESILGQTFGDLILLVADDESPDETEDVCRSYERRDARMRYHRHPRNIGPVDNFNWLLAQPRSEYCLLVADDDWLDGDFAQRCIELLDGDPSLAIVCAPDRWDAGTAPPLPWPEIEVTDPSAQRRVLTYLRHPCGSNTPLYGVMRTRAAQRALPISNVMGADWLFVAAVAFSGRVVTTHGTHLNREHGGTSVSFGEIAVASRLSARAARNPHLAIAYNQFRDIAFSNRAYERLHRPQRIALGLSGVAMLLYGHAFDVVWDAVGPLVLHRRLVPLTGPLRDRWRARHAR